jgi:uncharacterized membrane protein YesL
MSFDAQRGGTGTEVQEPAWRWLPGQVAHAVWTNLPLLVVLDAVVVVAAVPTLVAVLSGGYLLAPAVAALTVVPAWAGVVAATDRLVAGDAVSWRTCAELLRRHARCGVALGSVAALVATAALGTLALIAANPGQLWLLLPLSADGIVAVLLVLAGLSVFSLATTAGLRGWTLVRSALELAGTHRMATAGSLALLILLGFAASWLPGLAAVVPAPLAVYLSACTAAAVQNSADATPSGGAGGG